MAKQVAFVTGAGQGIGEAIATRLHDDGFRVAVVDLNIDNAEKVAKKLSPDGSEAIGIKADVSDRDSVFAAVDKAVDTFGDFNVIVNNAGLGPTTPIDTITQTDLNSYMASMLGVFYGVHKQLIKHLRSWVMVARLLTQLHKLGLSVTRTWHYTQELNLRSVELPKCWPEIWLKKESRQTHTHQVS